VKARSPYFATSLGIGELRMRERVRESARRRAGPGRRRAAIGVALMTLLPAWGCRSIALHVAMPLLYREARLPAEDAILDIPYVLGPDADPEKHRLDLFVPPQPVQRPGGWPVLVFVHGGGWTSGDRALALAGDDVYRNIGRFFASRGVGTAVISYRLQPAVDWRDQVEDVARATWWVHEHVGLLGGDPLALFLSGHSAGAQLAAHVALRSRVLAERGIPPPPVCGLIPVSGSAYDLTQDAGLWRSYFEERFRAGDPTDAWMRDASPVFQATALAPPTLILYSALEAPLLRRQAKSLDAALRAKGVPSRILVVPLQDHLRIVLALSRPDQAAAPAMLDFIAESRCESLLASR
jgi:acetyl esterase/lipase